MDDPDNRTKFLAAEALRGEGGILLDRDGNRFCNDLGTRDYVTMRMWTHNKPPYRLVLNSKATSGIAWHCKHYCGRRVMQKMSGAELVKTLGISRDQLAKSFANYNSAAQHKNDQWKKRFFPAVPYQVDDTFMVATVTPIVHYVMGGLEISPAAEVISAKTGLTFPGLFAAGEVTGGVHGRNRLGGSALLECVVFGRVAGDSALKYLNAGKPANGQKAERVKPLPDSMISTIPPAHVAVDGVPDAKKEVVADVAVAEKRDYTLAEVSKHKTEQDCWVVVNGKVLNVTEFLEDHPGGKMAIMTFAGRDATEEFNMVHEEGTLEKYASEFILGNVKPGPKL
jgi:succinate dehydrogenase/fumarate reductase flavoprotein subunit